MDAVFDAVRSFLSYLGSIAWWAVALALLCHVVKMAARSRALRNAVAAAYPEERVPWRTVAGAYTAGIGVNTLVPARGGDLLQLFLIRRNVEHASYPTLAATLLVLALFDTVVASGLLVWALLATDALPGLDVVPRLPAVEWLWLYQHPRAAAAVTAALVLVAFAAGVWSAKHIHAFRARVAQGFAVLRSPLHYLRSVAAWQAVDWGLRVATVLLLLRAFDIPATITNGLLAQVAGSLATILPLTPSGIGTEQALLAYVLRGEASTGALLSFSVGMRLVLGAANVVLGFAAIALMLRTLRWRGVVDHQAEPEPARSDG
ncbi:MAG: flippase-like domain-containing protein [Thermoleophilia bacterium]|nr:flippase-like domain-containing protein [Thermoleophilia bacterium]